jgi:cytochrome b6-f complex iron-sulfur subunit
MTATTILIIGVAATGLLAAIGIFTVAARRGSGAGPITGELDKKAVRRDQSGSRTREAASEGSAASVAVMAPPEAEADAGPPPDPLLNREEITEAEMGVNRRKFFNRSLVALFAIFLGQFAIASLAFVWPKLKGGFGSPINVGNVDDLLLEIVQPDGTFVPKFVASAQSWLVPMALDKVPDSSFDGLPVVGALDGQTVGLMALWQRCVHLGCRVPSCVPSQGFECPCHGSRYNFHGEYEAGPAPRNMDRFVVEVDPATSDITDLTGQVVQTSRAKVKTLLYPQGPSCV